MSDSQFAWSLNQWVDEIQFLKFSSILGWYVVINLKFVLIFVQSSPHLVLCDIWSTSPSLSLARLPSFCRG